MVAFRHQVSGVRVLLFTWLALASIVAGAEEERKPSSTERAYQTDSLKGKVVWLADALEERFGIKTDDDAAHAMVALAGADGRIHPLIKDARGRAFYADDRLRDIDLELLVRRYEGSPMLQVVRIYALKGDGKYELDYWCDICSIAMYELKSCECCQGPTRLRERRVEQTSSESRSEKR